MDSLTKEIFRRAVIDALAENAYAVDPKSDIYGWRAENWEEIRNKIRNGKINYDETIWTEERISQFTDTFNDPDERYVIDITVVMYNGGKEYKLRYDGTLGELLRLVLEL